MVILFEEHKLFLEKLLKAEVEFILVGGYAVNFYGYNRPTGDMDVWLNPTKDNQQKIIALFRNEGYSDESILQIESLDFTKHLAFHIGKDPFRIDFLNFIQGVSFAEAKLQQQLLPFKDKFVPVLHLHHLVISKTNTDRLKDKADIEELQKINRKKNS